MRSWSFLLLSVTAAAVAALPAVQATNSSSTSAPRCFPQNFLLGSATSSYQVEGAWNESGRTPSIWDDWCHEQSDILCASVTDDFFHRYEQDMDRMVDTGFSSFRFSISWSRVMNWNNATERMERNQPGIDFYHDMIDALLNRGIVPVLTLFHWDMPDELHLNLSPQGWLNRAISDHFVDYAELMYLEFGSKVDYWTTFNEPLSFALYGYGYGLGAPGVANSSYAAAHNFLIAHAKAVKRFRDLKTVNVLRSTARIGMVLNLDYAYPLDASDPVDVAAADRFNEYNLGWFLQPIVSGEYPGIMRERAHGALPSFSPEESEMLKGSYDLFMLNHYTSHVVTDCASASSTVNCSDLLTGWPSDLGVDDSRVPEGARPSSMLSDGSYACSPFGAYPPGYLATIQWLHKHDTSADILLTENGYCGNDEIENADQLWYYQTYLDQVHKAMTEDNIPIIGYTAWSFMDNFEWGTYDRRYGLFHVDFSADTGDKDGYTPLPTDLTRTPRLAARWFANFTQTKCLSSTDEQFTG